MHGVGNQRAFRDLHRLVAERHPYLLFICETKQRASQCQRWKFLLKLDGHFIVDSIGGSGGLMLFWKDSFDIHIKSFYQGHIDCVIRHSHLT